MAVDEVFSADKNACFNHIYPSCTTSFSACEVFLFYMKCFRHGVLNKLNLQSFFEFILRIGVSTAHIAIKKMNKRSFCSANVHQSKTIYVLIYWKSEYMKCLRLLHYLG
ncbi:hypothetical protein VCUG_02063 [Vavraia culicis subsp. floridensis]|uniref:Uncharacterized protein n=1 Tax=Vavraia culicis (isolate floridensis) TaxID=948595 RepID=L2GT61_VAVCU|nr:uncharacterized protein VCUG_02063 [Vavraia culicis subsp. floridensis]ELA46468.1 hypothetical protein VCUG_02063 [Vavraia culicis subsp. floridensis]